MTDLPTGEDIEKAFESIQQSRLDVNTIVCSECGCAIHIDCDDKPCEHLTELFRTWKETL